MDWRPAHRRQGRKISFGKIEAPGTWTGSWYRPGESKASQYILPAHAAVRGSQYIITLSRIRLAPREPIGSPLVSVQTQDFSKDPGALPGWRVGQPVTESLGPGRLQLGVAGVVLGVVFCRRRRGLLGRSEVAVVGPGNAGHHVQMDADHMIAVVDAGRGYIAGWRKSLLYT